MLVKCHGKFVELHKAQSLLDKYRNGERKAAHLQEREVKEMLNRFYPTEHCKKEGAFLDAGEAKDEEEGAEAKKKKDKKAYYKSGHAGKADQFSIITVTLALGKQLLHERQQAAVDIA